MNPRQVSGLVSWQGLVPFGMLFLFGFGWISRYFQPNQVDSEAAQAEVPMMRDEPLSWWPASAEKVGGARLRESRFDFCWTVSLHFCTNQAGIGPAAYVLVQLLPPTIG